MGDCARWPGRGNCQRSGRTAAFRAAAVEGRSKPPAARTGASQRLSAGQSVDASAIGASLDDAQRGQPWCGKFSTQIFSFKFKPPGGARLLEIPSVANPPARSRRMTYRCAPGNSHATLSDGQAPKFGRQEQEIGNSRQVIAEAVPYTAVQASKSCSNGTSNVNSNCAADASRDSEKCFEGNIFPAGRQRPARARHPALAVLHDRRVCLHGPGLCRQAGEVRPYFLRLRLLLRRWRFDLDRHRQGCGCRIAASVPRLRRLRPSSARRSSACAWRSKPEIWASTPFRGSFGRSLCRSGVSIAEAEAEAWSELAAGLRR